MKPRRANRRNEIVVMAVVCAAAVFAVAVVVFRSTGNHHSVAVTIPTEASRTDTPSTNKPLENVPTPAIAPSPRSARSTVHLAPTTARTHTNPAIAKKSSDAKSKPLAAKDGPDRPIARQALDLVGEDPVAEAVWFQAISDPTVSPHDRQDLIEDLNENGFDDPAHPSADDLPLIENRLAIIEELAPLAMDDVNAAAFAEAYKDLVNMRVKALAD